MKLLSNYLIEFRGLPQYAAISAVALILDYGVFWLLASPGALDVGLAATIGYSCGLVFAYFLMSARLFRDSWLATRRRREFGLFAVSGLIGIGLTYIVTEVYVGLVRNDLHAAKLAAIVISFVAVYVFRRLVVFRPVRSHGTAP